MLRQIIGFASGLVFGLGLLLSGMTDPAKVLGFLDIAGAWDISLALVMGGGLAVAAVGFAMVKRQSSSWTGDSIELPNTRQITPKLLVGAGLFGAGWGLAGICPGPGVVLAGTGAWQGVMFVIAMLVGMFGWQWLAERG